jgi:hypothetical protein
VIKVIQRLEKAVSEGFVDVGIAICLTNDFNYWNPSAQARATIFEAFRMTEGLKLSGELAWGIGASPKFIGSRVREPIRLLGEYTVRWRPYSKVPANRNGEFKYLWFDMEHT